MGFPADFVDRARHVNLRHYRSGTPLLIPHLFSLLRASEPLAVRPDADTNKHNGTFALQ